MENASHQYSYDRVKQMIERQKERYQWEFLFLGANIDAVSVAGRFGIDHTRAVRYEHDEEGTRLNFRVMSKAVSYARASESAEAMRDCFDDDELLAPILNIEDPRTDSRIDFVGGIHGLGALEKKVNSRQYAAAFALYPTDISELFSVADAGRLMPPKSTWFEPKLRSGLFIHRF